MNTISFPKMFDVNSNKLSTNLSYNYQSIHESLTSLMLTNPGELLGDPAYGCEIRQQLLDKGIVLEDTRQGVKWKRA